MNFLVDRKIDVFHKQFSRQENPLILVMDSIL